mmetsp:Transcript_16443/g.33536  ORF Transcript_16443/g.33536 Transcript_16443/m.33536 type:complete len:163 (-) Transcript_16443:2279-2767(-)
MSTNSTVLQHPPQSSISSLNSDPESEHADDENALGDPVNPGDVCDVIMIVDNREVRGMGPSRSDMQRLIAEATKLPVEVRNKPPPNLERISHSLVVDPSFEPWKSVTLYLSQDIEPTLPGKLSWISSLSARPSTTSVPHCIQIVTSAKSTFCSCRVSADHFT